MEKVEIIQKLQVVRKLEEAPREKRKPPKGVILYGGGGTVGFEYAHYYGTEHYYGQAGLPVFAVADIVNQTDSKSLAVLPHAEYFQVSEYPSILEAEVIAERFPDAAWVLMTPQNTHSKIFAALAPIFSSHEIPVWINKTVGVTTDHATETLDAILKYPNLAHLAVTGSFTIDKATPMLYLLGLLEKNHPGLAYVKPLPATSEEQSAPDFLETYGEAEQVRQKLGRLMNYRTIFMEGRMAVRDVVGHINRHHLATASSGGITGDMFEHAADVPIRLGLLGPENSKFALNYFGYTPIGLNKTSVPWQPPTKEEMEEDKFPPLGAVEGAFILIGENQTPVSLSFGKREPMLLGDVRRAIAQFENGMLTTYYISGEQFNNQFTISLNNGPTHRYYLAADPFRLMLSRYAGLWSGEMQGYGGLYAHSLVAVMLDDAQKIWVGEQPRVFPVAEKAKNLLNERLKKMRREEYRQIQEKDRQILGKMYG